MQSRRISLCVSDGWVGCSHMTIPQVQNVFAVKLQISIVVENSSMEQIITVDGLFHHGINQISRIRIGPKLG